jgi:hypothetical protein
MAKRGVDLAGAVAMDPVMLGPEDFRRRLHGMSLATASRRYNKSGSRTSVIIWRIYRDNLRPAMRIA